MLRAVVREDLSYEMASDLVADLKTVVEWLDHHFTYSGKPCTPQPASLHPACPAATHTTLLHESKPDR